MSKLNAAKTIVTQFFGRTALLTKAHMPEILMATGTILVAVGTVKVGIATLKAEEILDEAHAGLADIHAAEEIKDPKYTAKDIQKDTITVYTHAGVKFLKLYGPAATMVLLGIACFFGANTILRKRNIALMAAYKLLEKGFSDYRQRVVEEYGEEKDYDFKHGIRREEMLVTETDADGNETISKVINLKTDPNNFSQYYRIFDESCDHFTRSAEYNKTFLLCQQNFANDILRTKGHLFLNEVYDMLGFEHSQAGAVVGWIISKGGDNYVDFGLTDVESTSCRRFVNGSEAAVILDFNVDGVIWDKISDRDG